MIDLRINVIWTSGQHDSLAVILFQPRDDPFTFRLNICPDCGHFFPAPVSSCNDFRCGKTKFIRCKDSDQSFRKDTVICHGQEWMDEPDMFFLQILDIVFDIFRIGSNHRTIVMVISVRWH